MSTWVSEHAGILYLILGLAGALLVAAWWLARSAPRRGGVAPPMPARTYLVGLVAVAALVGVVWVVDHFADTDSKQIERALDAMSAGVAAGDVDQIFAHVSDSFILGGRNKASFRPFVQNEIRNGGVSSVKVWDIDIKTLSREQRQATVVFKVKARGSQVMDPGVYNCRAEFVLDPDNQWRLKTFTLFLPQTDPMKGEPLPLPIG